MATIFKIVGFPLAFGGLTAGIILGMIYLSPSQLSIERHSTVEVFINGKNSSYSEGIGSGVYLGNGYILTARHVVLHDPQRTNSDRNKMWVKDWSGQIIPANPVLTSEDADYAIIRVFKPFKHPPPAAHLTCRQPIENEAITLVGMPEGALLWAVTHGRVSTTRIDEAFISRQSQELLSLALIGWKHVVIADIRGNPGVSGGPVFDASGNVIGVMVMQAGEYMGFVPTSQICREMPRIIQ